jgi:aminopeptidase N
MLKTYIKSLLVLVLPLMFAASAPAQSLFAVRDQGEARDKSYHVVHYKIEVSFDEAKKMVLGKVTTTLTPYLPELSDVQFDAEQMQVQKVTMNGKDLKFDILPKMLDIHLDKSIGMSDTITLTTEYTCTPKKGIYFVQPDSTYPDKPWQIWSQGEDMDNHFWFPCYDFPNDKATSEVIATVQSKYNVLSNGKLIDVKENKKDGTKTFHWSESKPHASYLIMICVGDYAIVQDHAGSLPVQYYVYKSDTADARACLSQTPAMIKFFGEKIGFPYPWEKYDQVVIRDFMYGGMENTTATTMADNSLVYDARQRVDNLPTGLIAHELAHQWWGDCLTCKDWRHIWLNESFATYFEALYHEHSLGRDEFDYEMFGNQNAGISTDTSIGRKPVVSVGSYTNNIYPRGASILHMLRFVTGEELFWKGINHYIVKNQFTPVETNDLKIAFQEATGQNLYWFFDEWLYKAGHPVFDVSYTWSDSDKAIHLAVKQTQKTDSLTGIFRTPVDIEITSPAGVTTTRVNIMNGDTTFTIASAAKPQLVIFDKGDWLLKELFFDKSNEEWAYQAASAANPIDRVRAIQHMNKSPKDETVIPILAKISSGDAFWAVRREAVNALGGRTDTSSADGKAQIKTALLAACGDKKSQVRSAAVSQLGKYRGDDVVAALRTALNDSSYGIVTASLRSLTKADSAHAAATMNQYIDLPSYRNSYATTALNMLAQLDSVQGVTLALGKLKNGVPSEVKSTAIRIVQKYGKGRKDVTMACLSLVDDPNRGVKNSAVAALGDVGDADTIPSLQKIADDPDNGAADTAKRSIEKIKKRLDKSEKK